MAGYTGTHSWRRDLNDNRAPRHPRPTARTEDSRLLCPNATGSALDDVGPPFVPLRRRSLLYSSGDSPHVTGGIDNPRRAIAPELVLHRKQDLRAGGHRPLYRFVHI